MYDIKLNEGIEHIENRRKQKRNAMPKQNATTTIPYCPFPPPVVHHPIITNIRHSSPIPNTHSPRLFPNLPLILLRRHKAILTNLPLIPTITPIILIRTILLTFRILPMPQILRPNPRSPIPPSTRKVIATRTSASISPCLHCSPRIGAPRPRPDNSRMRRITIAFRTRRCVRQDMRVMFEVLAPMLIQYASHAAPLHL